MRHELENVGKRSVVFEQWSLIEKKPLLTARIVHRHWHRQIRQVLRQKKLLFWSVKHAFYIRKNSIKTPFVEYYDSLEAFKRLFDEKR